MNTNSRSEQVWILLHQTAAQVTSRGFVENIPLLPTPGNPRRTPSINSSSYNDLVERYRDRLTLGASWPEGHGSATPLALVISMRELSPEELAFVTTWFENPKVNYPVDTHLRFQPLPSLAGEAAPYREIVEGLCGAYQPRAVFCLGPRPAQLLLGAPLSLETLRQGDFRIGSWALLTTLDPADYLALPESPLEPRQKFKALVWKDLQRLVGKLRYA